MPRGAYVDLGTVLYFQRDFPAADEDELEGDHALAHRAAAFGEDRGGAALWFIEGRHQDTVKDCSPRRANSGASEGGTSINSPDAVAAGRGSAPAPRRVDDAGAERPRCIEQALALAPDLSPTSAAAVRCGRRIRATSKIVTAPGRADHAALGYSKEADRRRSRPRGLATLSRSAPSHRN